MAKHILDNVCRVNIIEKNVVTLNGQKDLCINLLLDQLQVHNEIKKQQINLIIFSTCKPI